MRVVRIGLLGCGNVGGAFWELVHRTRTYLAARDRLQLEIRRVLVREPHKRRSVAIERELLTTDPADLIEDPQIDVIVEALGGFEPGRTYLLEALQQGKHVVSANKVVVARAWRELNATAARSGASLAFEAAVGAAIPVVQSIREVLSSVPLHSVYGILNGTSNYILSRMADGFSFEDALAESQQLGYAEPDPGDDLDGRDAMYKISLLAALAFDWDIDLNTIPVEGIRGISTDDIAQAQAEGGMWRLVARASRDGGYNDGPVRLAVRPEIVPASDPLYAVHGVENAVVVQGDPLGTITLRGPGAGPGPTASALLADVRSLARNHPDYAVRPVGALPEGVRLEAGFDAD